MVDIRTRDLRFSREETSAYLKKIFGVVATEESVSALEEKTEGWITGIHLATLALGQDREDDECVSDLTGDRGPEEVCRRISLLPTKTRYILEYFSDELFSKQPSNMKDMLLGSAILKQFNAGLCEAVCADIGTADSPAMSGREFIRRLGAANLFVIALDDEGEWYRFHHLFRQLLMRILQRTWRAEEISALHKKASAWLERHGRVSEAIDHALASGDVAAAARVLERQRHGVLDTDNWPLLANWVARFPEASQEQLPAILITKAYLSNFGGTYWALPPILDKLDLILQNSAPEPSLAGEIDFFKALLLFWDGRIAAGLEGFQCALRNIDASHSGVRNEIEIYIAVASQMLGRGQAVVEQYQKIIYHQTKDGPRKARLIGGLIFICLLSGDLAEALRWCEIMLDLAVRTQNTYIHAWGDYVLGYIHYQRHEPAAAIRHFSQAIDNRFFLDLNAPVDSYAGLALAYQAMQQPEKADATIARMLEFTQQVNNIDLMNLACAVKAELLLARDDPAAAADQIKGLADLESDNSPMVFWITEPRITQCKVLLAQRATDSREMVAQRLDRHLASAQATNNFPQTITILILKAAACERGNDPGMALSLLERALALARPGGWIRPFVMPGPEMKILIARLERRQHPGSFIDTIITALDVEKAPLKSASSDPQQRSSPPSVAQSVLAASLTGREMDILDLLKRRLSNQEIADTLYISPETVKRHLYNIYKKLAVKNRREAAVKIAGMTI